MGIVNPNLEEEEVVGVADGTIQKSVGDFLWALHSNFSSNLTSFRDIAAFVLQHAAFSDHTSILPKIFPCSPGSKMTFGLRRAKMLG